MSYFDPDPLGNTVNKVEKAAPGERKRVLIASPCSSFKCRRRNISAFKSSTLFICTSVISLEKLFNKHIYQRFLYFILSQDNNNRYQQVNTGHAAKSCPVRAKPD